MSTSDYVSMSEAAARNGISRSYLHRLLKAGQIPGAQRLHQRAWLIPADWRYERRRPGAERNT